MPVRVIPAVLEALTPQFNSPSGQPLTANRVTFGLTRYTGGTRISRPLFLWFHFPNGKSLQTRCSVWSVWIVMKMEMSISDFCGSPLTLVKGPRTGRGGPDRAKMRTGFEFGWVKQKRGNRRGDSRATFCIRSSSVSRQTISERAGTIARINNTSEDRGSFFWLIKIGMDHLS